MASFIGIDLGTTFSALAVIDETGRPKIVANSEGQNITPSCVTEFDGNILVGEYARKTWGPRPDEAAARFKRDMGTSKLYKINQNDFTSTELSTFVLKKLVQDANELVGEIGEAVVTVPANFANEAREATMAAAKAAGLNVKYIINEPTAAALYYAFQSGEELYGNYVIYDLGGGTFDVSIIRVDGQNVDVLASNGLHKLGGDDFDKAILDLVAAKYKLNTGEELDNKLFNKNEAEEVKKSLSKIGREIVMIGRDDIKITKEDFDEAISALITQTEMICESTIDEAGILLQDIKGVLLAGGSTRIPAIRDSVSKVFAQEPTASVNVDEVIALGAALYAAYKGDKTQLNPIQKAAIDKIKVGEVTGSCFGTISLGVQDSGKEQLQNSVLIEKGTKIPCSVTQEFFTVNDGQSSVRCQVTEATESETDPSFVNIVWEGNLVLPEGRRAGQQINITFAFTDNQTMRCEFLDVATGKATNQELAEAQINSANQSKIDKFLVE